MAKKRIPEVPRDGSDADFVPENYMLIDGAEGSAKMRMDLFGKASAVEELDEVKYEKPEDGIPKTDLAEGVQGSLGLADTALQASDIEGKAEKSEMSITNVPDDTTKKTIQLKDGLSHIVVVDHQDISGKAEKSEMSVSAVSGDDTKKTIQLKSGLTQNVVVEHQDITGKADTSAMSITNVSGDSTKKTIQLKTGLSQDVVVEHQDISGKADKSEMSISAGEDDTKRTIQLKNGTSQSVVVSHQDISGKAEASEMNISAVAGDETKKKIQLKTDLSQNVVIEHQDISGKAEKSEMSISAVSGDESKMKIQLKSGTSQNVVIEHQNISGKADKSEMLINAVSGDDTKKTIQLYNGLSQDVVIDVSGKADTTDVLTTWQPVAAEPATGKLAFHSTRYPTRTEIMLKDATRPGGTVAEDVVVGYTVPNIELGNVGKYLMVDSHLGTSWQSVEHTLSYPSATEGEYSTLRGIISFQTDNTPLRTSAYLAASNYEPTCLGMFVPPVKREDTGRILIVDENEGPVWRDPPSTDPEITWTYGDSETRQGTLSVGTTLEYDSEEQAYYPHHSSAYIEYNSSTTWLGAFVPPTDIGDAGKFLMVDPTNGVEWKSVDYQPRLTAGDNITIDWQNTISAAVPIDFWYTQNYESEVSQTLDGGFYDDSLDIPVPDAIAYGQVKCFIHFAVCVSDLTAPTHLTVRFDNRLSTIADGTHAGQFSPEPHEHSSMFTQHTVDGEVAYFTDCLYAYSSNSNITDHWHCVLHYDAPSGSRVGTVVKIKYCVLCAMGKRFDSRTIGDIRNAWPSNTI